MMLLPSRTIKPELVAKEWGAVLSAIDGLTRDQNAGGEPFKSSLETEPWHLSLGSVKMILAPPWQKGLVGSIVTAVLTTHGHPLPPRPGRKPFEFPPKIEFVAELDAVKNLRWLELSPECEITKGVGLENEALAQELVKRIVKCNADYKEHFRQPTDQPAD